MSRNTRKIKKRIAAGAATAVTAASILTNSVVSNPADLLKSSSPDASDNSHVLILENESPHSYILETDQYEPYTWKEQLCIRMQKLPLPVKSLVLLPLWGIGEVITVLLSSLWSSPIGQAIFHFLLEAAVLIGLFVLVFKLLFPDVPLKSLFSKKNLLWIILGAVLLTAADLVLGILWDQWHVVRIILMIVCALIVLMILWVKLCGKLPLPKRIKKRVELVIQ